MDKRTVSDTNSPSPARRIVTRFGLVLAGVALAVGVVGSLALAGGGSDTPASAATSHEREPMPTPKEIAQRQLAAAFAGDMAALRALYHDDATIRDPDGEYPDPDTYLAHLAQQLAPFPDVTYAISRLHAGEDFAVVEWTATGTNTGPITLPDGTTLPPTGRTTMLPVLTLYEVRDGKIAVERNYWDNASLLAQLGLLPEPAP